MLSNRSIRQLYFPALTEGEGVGTAYEYYVKRLALGRWLAGRPRPASLLIAGLPQKYGSSLDFFLLAEELGARLTVLDERPEALVKGQRAIAAMQQAGRLTGLDIHWVKVDDLAGWDPQAHASGLAICSEVLQRVPAAARPVFAARFRQAAPLSALFCPNRDNEAHVGLSGLGGVTLGELQALFPGAASGYIDMPPFPPGITRTESQRAQATSGRMEALAMWGLGLYARAERWLPAAVRRRQAHIVYAFSAPDGRKRER